VITLLRCVLRIPLIVVAVVCAPVFWTMAFAMGDSPREAWSLASDFVREMTFGRLS
jgi:hypothetical protein